MRTSLQLPTAGAANDEHAAPPSTRRHTRRPLVARVSFESGHTFFTGTTGDISQGGLFVCTDELPETGTELTVLLSLAGQSRPWVIRGVVRWVRDRRGCGPAVHSGFGLQFTRVSAEALEAIARFVDPRELVVGEV